LNLKELFSFEKKEMLDAQETTLDDIELIEKESCYYLFDFGGF